MRTLRKKFNNLKSIDFSRGVTSLWILKRKLHGREAQYLVQKVEVENKLKRKLKEIIINKIEKSNAIKEYLLIDDDQDDQVLGLDCSGTDFDIIKQEIDTGSDCKKIENANELLDSWAYVIKIQKDNESIYALRKISKDWNTKNIVGWMSLYFKDEVLIDLDDKQVFKIDSNIDFLCYDNMLFILNKKQFESALNFRAGMEKNRDEIIEEFQNLGIFNDDSLSILKEVIGNNMRLLRKISTIKKNGYYKDINFLKKLEDSNEKNSWGLIINGGEILITEENISLILTLLNNDRLESPINEEMFDVSVKRKIN